MSYYIYVHYLIKYIIGIFNKLFLINWVSKKVLQRITTMNTLMMINEWIYIYICMYCVINFLQLIIINSIFSD